jgi:cob(I)alamin adenosyltransferase
MSSEEERFKEPALAINKVYTRKGDEGDTRLVGGQRAKKSAWRIQCYGTVDELNAIVGLARTSCLEAQLESLSDELLRVQHALFNLGTMLATLPADMSDAMPQVTDRDVDWLEASMDAHNESLPSLRSFVLPGGCRANAELHLARTVCRRAERLCVEAAPHEDFSPFVIAYLNRLSDAFFVWSRSASVSSKSPEVLWAPNKA